jgi:hypothetical protein
MQCRRHWRAPGSRRLPRAHPDAHRRGCEWSAWRAHEHPATASSLPRSIRWAASHGAEVQKVCVGGGVFFGFSSASTESPLAYSATRGRVDAFQTAALDTRIDAALVSGTSPARRLFASDLTQCVAAAEEFETQRRNSRRAPGPDHRLCPFPEVTGRRKSARAAVAPHRGDHHPSPVRRRRS